MEKELERLRRHLETLKLRHNQGAKKAKEQSNTKDILKAEIEVNGGQLIHYDEDRLQAIKYRPQSLALDNLSYEKLEDLIEAHNEELENLKNEYSKYRSKGISLSTIPEGLTYEEATKMRVHLLIINRKKILLNYNNLQNCMESIKKHKDKKIGRSIIIKVEVIFQEEYHLVLDSSLCNRKRRSH